MPALTGLEADAVRAFGIEPERLDPDGSGRVNRHWAVAAASGQFFLRQYRPDRSEAAIAWEHGLLRHARGRGWPVACAIAGPGGATAVTLGGARFALFPALPGESPCNGGPARWRIAGRLLARLHHDLQGFDECGQRDGFGRAWELDVFVRAAGGESFNALLAAFGREHPRIAATLRRERYRNLRELARLGYGELPAAVIHGDFRAANLRFSGPELTGVLDFDLARRDAACFDLAAAIASDCLEGPAGDAIDLGLAGAFLDGYARQRRPGEGEARLIPGLVRASILWLAMFRLLQWSGADSGDTARVRARAVASLARSAERRLAALDARAPGLLELALRAASA